MAFDCWLNNLLSFPKDMKILLFTSHLSSQRLLTSSSFILVLSFKSTCSVLYCSSILSLFYFLFAVRLLVLVIFLKWFFFHPRLTGHIIINFHIRFLISHQLRAPIFIAYCMNANSHSHINPSKFLMSSYHNNCARSTDHLSR